jgi:RimJ/RimL family protein N-acetyltransferase
MISIDTERLTVRNFRPDDWQQLQEVIAAYQASDEARFEPPWPTSDDDVKGIAAWFSSGDAYLAVCLKPIEQIIGLVAIDPREGQERAHNLGYVFHPGHGGHGYATEACRAAIAYVFGALGADRILTGTNPENVRSVNLLERLGLHAIGNGEWTLTREEWAHTRSEG